jgi:hypothetical protein
MLVPQDVAFSPQRAGQFQPVRTVALEADAAKNSQRFSCYDWVHVVSP